ncbi:dCMP deaminase family protein [bacterium]|nr:dCMP deaminase family protein [bacterium]
MGIKPKFVKYFATIAEETAKLSSAIKLQVGCVIVKDNRILSVGYNGTPSGWDNECEEVIKWPNGDIKFLTTKPEVLHAEANALMKLCQSTESSKGATLFVTHTPCIECAKLIYQAGILQVYYINQYDATKGCGQEFLEKAGIECQIVS